ncbi:MAG TPA: DUF2911 domain-containing protein [Flavisolibacter sp.]|nr:DUF2911 domain-containing protein [Flavisolibacter sp.]
MKFLLSALTILFFSLNGKSQATQKQEDVCYNPNLVKDTTKKSIKSIAEGRVGDASFTINYHSPGVRKRIIWGGLVPFDEVWVTGAHDATAVTFNKDIIINKQKIQAGKYALFTIPGEKEWTFIINKNYNQHLASEYDEKDDVIRVNVKPQAIDHLERLQYFIEPANGKNGTLSVAWEKIKIVVPFQIAN